MCNLTNKSKFPYTSGVPPAVSKARNHSEKNVLFCFFWPQMITFTEEREVEIILQLKLTQLQVLLYLYFNVIWMSQNDSRTYKAVLMMQGT